MIRLLLALALLVSVTPSHAQYFPEDMPGFDNPDYMVPMYEPMPAPSPLSPGGYCALCVKPEGMSPAVQRHFQRQQRQQAPAYSYGWQPSPPSYQQPSYNRQSLNTNPYADAYGNTGAEYYGQPDPAETLDQMRRNQEQWRLQDLYQNAKPQACGPAFDPRAREGC